MGSWSQSTTQDNRAAVEEVGGDFVSPESQLANPLGINIKAGHGVDVSYGDVYYNDLEAVNDLVSEILESSQTISQEAIQAIEDVSSNLADSVATNQADLTGIVEAIKTPLAKYIPYAVLAVVLIVIVKVKGLKL